MESLRLSRLGFTTLVAAFLLLCVATQRLEAQETGGVTNSTESSTESAPSTPLSSSQPSQDTTPSLTNSSASETLASTPDGSTTGANATEPSTAAPPASSSDVTPTNATIPAQRPCRSFDTASFVGGMSLGLSLCAFLYLLFKCYMARRPGGRAPYNQF